MKPAGGTVEFQNCIATVSANSGRRNTISAVELQQLIGLVRSVNLLNKYETRKKTINCTHCEPHNNMEQTTSTTYHPHPPPQQHNHNSYIHFTHHSVATATHHAPQYTPTPPSNRTTSPPSPSHPPSSTATHSESLVLHGAEHGAGGLLGYVLVLCAQVALLLLRAPLEVLLPLQLDGHLQQ